jgi:hypothetical protein
VVWHHEDGNNGRRDVHRCGMFVQRQTTTVTVRRQRQNFSAAVRRYVHIELCPAAATLDAVGRIGSRDFGGPRPVTCTTALDFPSEHD